MKCVDCEEEVTVVTVCGQCLEAVCEECVLEHECGDWVWSRVSEPSEG